MRILLIVQAVLLAALPAVRYSYINESVPFYAFDGVDYTCLFYLPATYFVAIEEEGEEYDRVTYLDLSGYVKSGDTEDVDYEPVTKYATTGSVTLKKGVASVYLYADADCTVVLSSVTASDSLFLYGQSAYEGVYYCRLKGMAGTTRGYIGGEGIIVTLPEENTVEAVTPPEDEPEEENPGEETDPGGGGEAEVSLPVEIILVVSLAVPAFIVVFLLTRKRGS